MRYKKLKNLRLLTYLLIFRCARRHDVITVRDGATRDSPVLATYCGNTSGGHVTVSQPFIVSSGHSALLEFVSDDHDQRQGFAATFRFLASDKLPSLVRVTQPTPVIPSSRVGRQPPPIKPSAPVLGNVESKVRYTLARTYGRACGPCTRLLSK